MVLVAPTWDDARRAAHDAGRVLPTEVVPVSRADRRVLVEGIRARTPLPPRDASAMDGWAVRGAGPWQVVDDVRAGQDRAAALEPGQAVAIATGAVLPPETSGVLRSEHGSLDATGLLDGATAEGTDIRPAGEEAGLGELLIPEGTVLTPAHVGLAAAGGYDELAVVRRPSARFLVFGDELLRTGSPREGKIRDSLGAQVPAWLGRMGFDIVGVEWVPDTREAHVQARWTARTWMSSSPQGAPRRARSTSCASHLLTSGVNSWSTRLMCGQVRRWSWASGLIDAGSSVCQAIRRRPSSR